MAEYREKQSCLSVKNETARLTVTETAGQKAGPSIPWDKHGFMKRKFFLLADSLNRKVKHSFCQNSHFKQYKTYRLD